MKKSISQLNYDDLGSNSSWALQATLAFVGTKVPLRKVGDKYSPSATIERIRETFADGGVLLFEDGRGCDKYKLFEIFKALNTTPRGKILGTSIRQTATEGLRYNRGVPLLLSSFKEYRDIPYSAWDWSDPNMQHFVDSDIMALVPYILDPSVVDYSTEELLQFRVDSQVIKSTGKTRSLKSCTSITNCVDPEFSKLPALLKLMLCQVWVYLPEYRNKWMITNIHDIDSYPKNLVDTQDILTPIEIENPFI